MIIRVDQEGQKAIEWMGHVVLKALGNEALQNMVTIYGGVKLDGNPGDGTYPRLVSEESSGEIGDSQLQDRRIGLPPC